MVKNHIERDFYLSDEGSRVAQIMTTVHNDKRFASIKKVIESEIEKYLVKEGVTNYIKLMNHLGQ